jgi:hypothetical protein
MFDVSARNCWGTHSLPATFPGTQNARSLLGRPVRTVGTYSRLRRCGRSQALVTAASSDTTSRGRAGQSGRLIGRGIACSTSWWADGRAFIGGTASGGSARVIRLNYSGGSSVFICRGLGLHGAHRCKTGQDMSSQPSATESLRWFGVGQRTLMAWRLLSAIMLLVMGGIHLYLVFYGVGGLLGALFVLNAVGALVLAIAVIVLRGRLLSLATVLSLLFMVGTLLALVLALTVGLFGIHEVLSFKLVPTTLVVESIGTIILAVTVALVLRSRRAP